MPRTASTSSITTGTGIVNYTNYDSYFAPFTVVA